MVKFQPSKLAMRVRFPLPADPARFSPLWHPGCGFETNPLARQLLMKCGIPVTENHPNCEITSNIRLFSLTFSRFHWQTYL
jgi:hypothetical protein